MGRVVTMADAHLSEEGGISFAALTADDLDEFAADLIRVPPGRRWSMTAPPAADTYLFALKGAGEIASGTERHAFAGQTFATVGAGLAIEVQATGDAPLDVIRVRTPLKPRQGLPGFEGTLAVAERSRCPVVPVPAEHKQRIYFCGHHGGAHTERGHAMIVVYDGETHTALHHHPDAESLFVLIDGACEFTVEDRQVVVGPGQVAYFRMNDRHGLKTAPGHAGASFLEFHIPAKFSTVKT